MELMEVTGESRRTHTEMGRTLPQVVLILYKHGRTPSIVNSFQLNG